jgi:hypothetical protein
MSCNTIRLKIFNNFQIALLDTGCGTSVVSERLVQKLRLPIEPIGVGESSVLYGAGGHTIHVLGKTEISLKLGGITVPFDFRVARPLTQDLILGIDFLEGTRAVIDCSDKTVTFFENMTSVNLLDNKRKIVACLDRNCVLEPRSENVVSVRLSSKLHNQCVLLEPVNVREKQKYAIAKAIVRPVGYNAACQILNPSNERLKLRKNLVVAQVQFIDENAIKFMGEPNESNVNTNLNININSVNDTCEVTDEDRAKLNKLGIKIDSDSLTEDERMRLTKLLANNSDLFALTLKDLPGTNMQHFNIDTGDARPIRQRPYRPNPTARTEIAKQTQEMLDAGVIIPSNSPWGSPCVLVKKKDGTMRFCIDYRKLNKVTKPLHYPLPLLADVYDTLSQNRAKYFSAMDLKSGYFQVPMDPPSQPKTAFVVQDGAYEFKTMPFGCTGAPAIFQLLMANVFRGMNFKNVMVYIDDILIFSPTFEEHLKALQEAFDRLRKADLRLHPQKCKWASSEISYLGHKINREGMKVDEAKIETIKNWPVPETLKALRGFLGLCSYYRRFVKDFAKIATPLHKLLRKDVKFEWIDECQVAFETLRAALMSTPVLGYADMSKPFILTTDASTESIGYILSQLDEDGQEHPLSFSGRSLRNCEKRWSITEIEGLALVEGIKENYPFLATSPFTIVSDHISLKWLDNIKHTNTGRLFRWSLMLQHLQYTVIHKAGKANANADALSRREYEPMADDDVKEEVAELIDNSIDVSVLNSGQSVVDSSTQQEVINYACKKTPEEDWLSAGLDITEETRENGFDESEEGVIFEFGYETKTEHEQRVRNLQMQQLNNLHHDMLSLQNLQEQQKNCPDLGRIIEYLQNFELPEDAKIARQTVAEATSYFFKDGLLYHHYTVPNRHAAEVEPIIEQLAIPSSLRTKVLYQIHDKGGHFNHDKTYLSLRARYFWPRMYTDCKLYCKTCHICQQIKSATHPEKAEMHPWNPTVVGGVWGCDVVGPLPEGKGGEKYILVCVEHMSKWIEGIPMITQEATEVADKLYKEIFTRFMAPAVLYSDRGKNFTGKVVARLCKLFAVNKINSSAYRPQSNGQVESLNRVLWSGLRAYCENQKEWPEFLPGILMGYRASVHETIGVSPFELMFGRTPRLPIDYELPLTPAEHSRTADEYMKKFIPKLKLMNKVAADRIKERQEKYKERYDKKTSKRDLQEGELYWLLTPPLTKAGLNKKMQPRYDKLVFIKSKEENDTYRCVEMANMKEISHAIHADRLKSYWVDTDYFPDRMIDRKKDKSEEDERGKEKENGEDKKAVGSTAVEQKRAKAHEYVALEMEDSEEEEPRSRKDSDSGGDEVDNGKKESQEWWPVKRLSGTKMMGKKRYYRVVWDKDEKPQWIDEKDVGTKLKIEYHKSYTLQGKKRKKKLTEDQGDKGV